MMADVHSDSGPIAPIALVARYLRAEERLIDTIVPGKKKFRRRRMRLREFVSPADGEVAIRRACASLATLGTALRTAHYEFDFNSPPIPTHIVASFVWWNTHSLRALSTGPLLEFLACYLPERRGRRGALAKDVSFGLASGVVELADQAIESDEIAYRMVGGRLSRALSKSFPQYFSKASKVLPQYGDELSLFLKNLHQLSFAGQYEPFPKDQAWFMTFDCVRPLIGDPAFFVPFEWIGRGEDKFFGKMIDVLGQHLSSPEKYDPDLLKEIVEWAENVRRSDEFGS